jgi:hypothetical protein
MTADWLNCFVYRKASIWRTFWVRGDIVLAMRQAMGVPVLSSIIDNSEDQPAYLAGSGT